MKKVTTRLPNESDLSDQTITHIVDMINKAYDKAESGMWKPGVARTNHALVKQSLLDKTLLLGEIDDEIVGVIGVKLMANETAGLGSLVADSTLRNQGIGSTLFENAQQWALEHHCKVIRLELLTPTNWSHPDKELLKQWYSRLGYTPSYTEPFANMYPEKVADLAIECDFTVWLKQLR